MKRKKLRRHKSHLGSNLITLFCFLSLAGFIFMVTDGFFLRAAVASSPSSFVTPTPAPTVYPTPFFGSSGSFSTGSSSSTPLPTEVSTPSPSPSPSPTPNGYNFVPIPSKWWIDREGQVLDYSVTYNGGPSIRLDPTNPSGTNPARECDARSVPINPGDHVVYSCWIKITASSKGDTSDWAGARLGIDFYDNTDRITCLQSGTWEDVIHDGIANWPSTAQGEAANYVHWGTQGWVKRTIDFIVPATMPTDGGSIGGSSHTLGGSYEPVFMIPMIQVWGSYGSTDGGQAWFCNPELFVNP